MCIVLVGPRNYVILLITPNLKKMEMTEAAILDLKKKKTRRGNMSNKAKFVIWTHINANKQQRKVLNSALFI